MKAKILSLMPQHTLTKDQVEYGVCPVSEEYKDELLALSDFKVLPEVDEVWRRARHMAEIANKECMRLGTNVVMIGGAPFLMAPLEHALEERSLTWCYAFSERISSEIPQEDGSVKKEVSFVFKGVYPPMKHED